MNKLFMVHWDDLGQLLVKADSESEARQTFILAQTIQNQASLIQCAKDCDTSVDDLVHVEEIKFNGNVSADRIRHITWLW